VSEPLETAIGLPSRAAAGSRLAGFVRGALGRTAGQGALALTDQVLVSGARFATSILIGRLAGPETLGNYTLGFALVVLVLGVQEALISTPYMIYANRLLGVARARYAGSVLIHYLLLSTLTVLALLGGAGVVWSVAALPGLVPVLLVMAGVIPFVLLQDLCRRMAMAHLHLRTALLLDVAVVTVQLGGLGLLAWGGMLSAATAYGPLGLATAIAGLSWLGWSRDRYRFRRHQIMPAMARNWAFGRWVFGGSTVSILQAYSVYWIMAILLGTTVAGLFAACQTVIMFSNPFLLGASNLLGPRAAQAFAQGGHRQVARVMQLALLLVGGAMAVFWLAVAVFGDLVVHVLYGAEYAGHEVTLIVLGASVFISSMNLVATAGLCAMERPQYVFAANATGLIVMLVVVVTSILPLQMLGVALGLMVGNIAGSAVALTALARTIAAAGKEASGTAGEGRTP
jgi:O-antigen/teichoic acid export membrane protein